MPKGEERLSLREAADALGVSEVTARRWVKAGKLKAHQPGRKYLIPSSAVDDLLESDLGKAPRRSSPEPSLNDALEDLRRTAWEAAVGRARGLRDPVRTQMWRAWNEWRASKQRGEPDTARREYLDKMGNLLQEAYGAYQALGEAYIQAALTQGGSEASVPSRLREESQAANDFYVDMFGVVRGAGLTIQRGADATAAKHAAEAPPEGRPHSVQEAG
jgi:excisionase family DNA binding protein